MSFRWLDGHMKPFLQSYRRYECLWNTKCNDYTKTSARENAYAAMVKDLNIPGLTVADIKTKIKTIRTRYGAELNKVKASERRAVDPDQIYEPRLFWYKDADAFLRNVCTSKANPLRLSDSELTETCNTSNYGEHFDSVTSKDPNHEKTGNTTTPKLELESHRYHNPRKRTSNPPFESFHSSTKFFKAAEVAEDSKQELNEFDVFCNSLAIQLKKMPLDRAIICQEKLQSVMTQERLFQLKSVSDSPVTNYMFVKEEDAYSDSSAQEFS